MAIFLRYFADLSYAEIGEVLGIAEGTVAATLSKAQRAASRRAFGRRGDGMSTDEDSLLPRGSPHSRPSRSRGTGTTFSTGRVRVGTAAGAWPLARPKRGDGAASRRACRGGARSRRGSCLGARRRAYVLDQGIVGLPPVGDTRALRRRARPRASTRAPSETGRFTLSMYADGTGLAANRRLTSPLRDEHRELDRPPRAAAHARRRRAREGRGAFDRTVDHDLHLYDGTRQGACTRATSTFAPAAARPRHLG